MMSRFDIERYDPAPDPDLVCCICTNVLFKPVETPCRHVFCEKCINTWNERKKTCPTCRSKIKKDDIKPVLPLVQNLINKLLLKCKNEKNGCVQKVALEAYDTHLKDCQFEEVTCGNSRCAQNILRIFFEQHKASCKFKEVLCEKSCGLLVLVSELKNHTCLGALKLKVNSLESKLTREQHIRDAIDVLNANLRQKVTNLEDELNRLRSRYQDSDSSDSDFSVVSINDVGSNDSSHPSEFEVPSSSDSSSDSSDSDHNNTDNAGDRNSISTFRNLILSQLRSEVSRLESARNTLQSLMIPTIASSNSVTHNGSTEESVNNVGDGGSQSLDPITDETEASCEARVSTNSDSSSASGADNHVKDTHSLDSSDSVSDEVTEKSSSSDEIVNVTGDEDTNEDRSEESDSTDDNLSSSIDTTANEIHDRESESTSTDDSSLSTGSAHRQNESSPEDSSDTDSSFPAKAINGKRKRESSTDTDSSGNLEFLKMTDTKKSYYGFKKEKANHRSDTEESDSIESESSNTSRLNLDTSDSSRNDGVIDTASGSFHIKSNKKSKAETKNSQSSLVNVQSKTSSDSDNTLNNSAESFGNGLCRKKANRKKNSSKKGPVTFNETLKTDENDKGVLNVTKNRKLKGKLSNSLGNIADINPCINHFNASHPKYSDDSTITAKRKGRSNINGNDHASPIKKKSTSSSTLTKDICVGNDNPKKKQCMSVPSASLSKPPSRNDQTNNSSPPANVQLSINLNLNVDNNTLTRPPINIKSKIKTETKNPSTLKGNNTNTVHSSTISLGSTSKNRISASGSRTLPNRRCKNAEFSQSSSLNTASCVTVDDDEDDPWEPSSIDTPTDVSTPEDCSSTEDESSYVVEVPKTAAQLLSEWNSSDSDDSWKP